MTGDQVAGEAFKAVLGFDPCLGGVVFHASTLDQVVMSVASDMGIPRIDILGSGRRSDVAKARVECVRRMRSECTNATIKRMAEALNAQENTVCIWLRKARNT